MIETRAPDSKESTPLQFRPLHKGVGFHPFSDGLPYAPAIPTRSSSPASNPIGTGAIAAGPALPVTRPQAQPLLSPRVPTAIAPTALSPATALPGAMRIPTPTLPRPDAFLRHQGVHPAATPPLQASTVTPDAPPRIETNFTWTYPLARCLAFAIDVVLNIAITGTVVTTGLAFADLEPWFLLEGTAAGMTLFFLVAFCWALMAAQELVFKTTLGKRLIGLRLRGTTTEIFLRSFFFIPSIAFGGVGILWACFDRDRRCWHDVAVGLQPTRATHL